VAPRLPSLDLRFVSRAIVAVLTLAVLAGFAWSMIAHSAVSNTGSAHQSRVSEADHWARLGLPPRLKDGVTLVSTDSEVLAWGGCSPRREDECRPTGTGFAFDPRTRSWRDLPRAPLAGAYAQVVWTGSEAIFLGLAGSKHRFQGEAYEPASESWRRIAAAPLGSARGAVALWTGDEVIVWGGGRRGTGRPRKGAVYDPVGDRWRRTSRAPIGLNLAHAVWTGDEMLVFGSLLNGRNIAATKTAVGAAYDPSADKWRTLPPSALSPQATSTAWTRHRMIAWDYLAHSQAYDPEGNRWTRRVTMPLRVGECYPDSARVRGFVFAFYCGQAALFRPSLPRWRRIHGGPLKAEIKSRSGAAYKRWRFAELVPAGDRLFLLAEGITFTNDGEPCYGCPGSPHSFWVYRP
jgi:hypothetical protein